MALQSLPLRQLRAASAAPPWDRWYRSSSPAAPLASSTDRPSSSQAGSLPSPACPSRPPPIVVIQPENRNNTQDKTIKRKAMCTAVADVALNTPHLTSGFGDFLLWFRLSGYTGNTSSNDEQRRKVGGEATSPPPCPRSLVLCPFPRPERELRHHQLSPPQVRSPGAQQTQKPGAYMSGTDSEQNSREGRWGGGGAPCRGLPWLC